MAITETKLFSYTVLLPAFARQQLTNLNSCQVCSYKSFTCPSFHDCNKYPSNLQTSYNFTGSETTNEGCAGIVKAQPVHSKNPAQHYADVCFLETVDNVSVSHALKGSVECVRVGGGVDEGPGHEEVQLFWTNRHLEKPTRMPLITSRDRGNSTLNRVELQNGMEGRARSGLFIPSTLHGSYMDTSTGMIDNEMLTKNLNCAIDLYNNAP
ncbi:uncharacterized protein LOC132743136 [Ruditapes philippinarum]|uniref:uncharacterized protein LOC132743136 n=1 Tax=Ruditapes philippinarum TaxID=129788 RepID=UPI00295C352F|nr:uncharacterized protein LOC132743136 [Ruditapes philippinarum]